MITNDITFDAAGVAVGSVGGEGGELFIEGGCDFTGFGVEGVIEGDGLVG